MLAAEHGLTVLHGDQEVHPDFAPVDGILVERFEGPLIFANADLFEAQMRRRVGDVQGSVGTPVVDFKAVSDVDVTGSDAVRRLHADLTADGVRLLVARANASVRQALERNGVLAVIGAENVRPTLREAGAGSPAPRPPRPRPSESDPHGDAHGVRPQQ